MDQIVTTNAISTRELTGGTEAIALYDRAVDRLLRFHPEVVDLATVLTTEHTQAPMGHALMAYLSLMSTDIADVAAAHHELAALEAASTLSAVERVHRDAVAAWAHGDWTGAARILRELLVQWPTDFLALTIGHQLDFFLGDAAELRDRPGRTLARLDREHPHFGFVLGMHAFGLEESGHYEMAETAALDAVQLNADDVWGVHAVAHTYEMQGRVDNGIRFMEARRADWGDGNLFSVHNWWHLALYYLEAGLHSAVLDLYDQRVHHAASAPAPLELLDASALLMRLTIDGVDTAGRFGPLAAAWDAFITSEPWYVFNDFHAVIAFAGAGRMDDARSVVRRLEQMGTTETDDRRTNVAMIAEVGLPAARAALAYFEGDAHTVISMLLPIRRITHRFGGSHAQRDLLARMLVQAAIDSGHRDLARALTDERLILRPTSTFGLARRAALAAADGDATTVELANAQSARYCDQFAAAVDRSPLGRIEGEPDDSTASRCS